MAKIKVGTRPRPAAPPSAPSRKLDVFPNPAPERDYVIRFDVPEFTCLCPLTGQPDFAHFTIEYIADAHCVETKSLKQYFWSFRNEGAFHEKVTNAILSDLVAATKPRFARIHADWFGCDRCRAYPATAGEPLREACAGWLQRRYGVDADPATQVLPVNGSREALFALAQTVVDPTRPGATVVPQPVLSDLRRRGPAGGRHSRVTRPATRRATSRPTGTACPTTVGPHATAVYVCSPGNPTGAVMPLSEWQKLFELSDRHGFVIASDECYSEIYFRDEPPLGGLEAAARWGRTTSATWCLHQPVQAQQRAGPAQRLRGRRCALMKAFLLYRTYHGSAMSPVVQAASIAAWNDEAHVVENRRSTARSSRSHAACCRRDGRGSCPTPASTLGRRACLALGMTDDRVRPRLAGSIQCHGAARQLPGPRSPGHNPGAGRIRMALVADTRRMRRGRPAHRPIHPIPSA
jgi:N-succinyldiaminopimelate aminotransferase